MIFQVAGLTLSSPDLDEGRRSVWAHLWPGGVVLAELLASELAPRVRGRTVIELGCGLGAVGLAAARAGGRVTLTDSEPDALALAAANAEANGIAAAVRLLEWSRVPADLAGTFDVVVGGDVTYDLNQVRPLFSAIEALLSPHGEAWIADPDRIPLEELSARTSLGVDRVGRFPPTSVGTTSDDSGARTVTVYHIGRGRCPDPDPSGRRGLGSEDRPCAGHQAARVSPPSGDPGSNRRSCRCGSRGSERDDGSRCRCG